MLKLAVDPQRIYVVGRSLGAMMALRMACDHADIIAGIACFDAAWPGEEQRASCVPWAPVHTLHIYGTAFGLPEGSHIMKPCPDTPLFHIGGVGVAEEWAGYNGCSLDTQEGLPLDLVSILPGDDTLVTRYTNCEHGGQVELWRIVGANHLEQQPPVWTDEFYTTILDWLLRRPKGSVSIKPMEVDFNSDYIIDIEDLIMLIERWGKNEPFVDIAPAPFGDGVVDAVDLEALMDYWGQKVFDPNLLAHWKLDEAEGDIAYDSAADCDGRLNGGPVWQPESGMVVGALQFDGVDDYLTAPFILDPVGQPFSVFAWIKGGQPGQAIISQQGAFGAWLSLDPAGALSTGLTFPLPPFTSDIVVTDDHWHRIGLVSDGSGMSLYVDDVEVARSNISPILPAHGALQIGAGTKLEEGSFWSGLIDDVWIYSRVVVP